MMMTMTMYGNSAPLLLQVPLAVLQPTFLSQVITMMMIVMMVMIVMTKMMVIMMTMMMMTMIMMTMMMMMMMMMMIDVRRCIIEHTNPGFH